jgi:curved DNA-binding protein CbpA
MERSQDGCQENPALTHYDDLGVSSSASDSEIREAYLSLVRLLHPDSHRDKNIKRFSELQMKRVSRAYAVLSDAERRKLYDAELERHGAPDQDEAPARPRRKTISAHALITWGWLICAFAGIIGIGWFVTQQSVSVSKVPSEVSAAPAPAVSHGGVEALTATAQGSAPTTDPNSPATDQDPVQSELRDVKAGRDRALEKAAIENKEIEFLTSQILSGPRSGAPAALSETSGFSGVWILSKPKEANAATAFTPATMDVILGEEHGILRGRFRSYYPATGRPDPVAVRFYFEGQVQGNVANLNWTSADGAKGEIQLKLASENALQLVWSATEPGTESGPSSGTALLVRKN